MTSIAFFAHDEKDAAVRRRVRGFEDVGCEVVGFAMRRSERAELGWNRVDLGRTYDAKYLQRIGAIFSGADRAAAASHLLARAEVVYARNLDMALCARMAMKKTGLSRPLVYECLDVHRLMHRRDLAGLVLRRLERALLKETALVVVSSPAFLREYFNVHHPGRFRARVVENRIAPSPALGPRPSAAARAIPPLRIGWFGVLRCWRSLRLLTAMAARFGSAVEISIRGYPDVMLPDFHERVRAHSNIRYRGRYRSPEDLAEIYDDIDLVWAGDFHDAGFNSSWLLPNRLYEGGYFAVPAIAPAASETGRWISDRGAGFTIDEPLESTLSTLLQRLIETPGELTAVRQRLLAFPSQTFLQPVTEMRDIIGEAIAGCRMGASSMDGESVIAVYSSDY